MDSPANNILAHSGLSLYTNPISTSVPGLLPASPTQDSSPRISGNSWNSPYTGESALAAHNSCSMASYGNLPLGASFGMNSKAAAYSSFGGSSTDLYNCRQMVHNMSPLNAMPAMRNYPSIYGDNLSMYQGHTGYNGGYFPDMTPGIPPFGRDLECRQPPTESNDGGKS